MSEIELVDRLFISDARDVRLHLKDAPDVFTPSGKLPIRPTSVHLHYSIPSGQLYGVVIVGDPTDERDRKRRGRTTWSTARKDWVQVVDSVKRRLAADALPAWLAELADKYRPRYVAVDAAGGAA